jgi:hypothetical protein
LFQHIGLIFHKNSEICDTMRCLPIFNIPCVSPRFFRSQRPERSASKTKKAVAS